MLLDRRYLPLATIGALLGMVSCGGAFTIIPISDQAATLGEPLTVNFTIAGAPTASASATSSRQDVVPDASIVITGSGTEFDITITPSSIVTGTTTITVTAEAGAAKATYSFRFTVNEPFAGSGVDLKGLNNELVGYAVAVSRDFLVAGGDEYAYVYSLDGDEWHFIQRLTASDAGPGQNFGNAVAVSENVIVVGSDTHDGGAAYVFERVGDTWTEIAKLVDPNASELERFGRSVSVEGDRILIGDPGDENLEVRSGSVTVYTKYDPGGWTLYGKLGPADPLLSDTFGEDADIDGDYIIAGNYGRATAGHETGSATIFRLDKDVWTLDDTLAPDELEAGDQFGLSVAIDGEYALVGSRGDSDAGPSAGAVYVFRRGEGGWVEVDKLVPEDAAESEMFGYSVALDYPYAVIGSPGDNHPVAGAGSVYVYRYDGTTWHLVTELGAPDPSVEAWFGSVAAISGWHLVGGGDGQPNAVAFLR